MIKRKPADIIGTKRDGAEVKSFNGVHFIVQCGCGAEFKCGRDRLTPSASSKLRCKPCTLEAQRVTGIRTQREQQAAYEAAK